MPDLSEKDGSIGQLLARLRERLGSGSFLVVDHWPHDTRAVGIARPDNLEVLAYISTEEADPERYFVSLELPPRGEWADAPYSPAGDQNVRGFEELATMLERHLSDAVA